MPGRSGRSSKSYGQLDQWSEKNNFELNHSKTFHVAYRTATVYDELSSGIKLLIPYTLWAIKLCNGPFDEQKPFADSVDIELHGQDDYVSKGAAICDTDLGDYSPM